MEVGVAVADALGVAEAVADAVDVRVGVGELLGVFVGVCVGVSVTPEEGVAAAVPVGVTLTDPAKVTVHPAGLAEIGFPSVSVSLMICSPSALEDPADPRALNVTPPTLTNPVGDVMLAALNAEIRVIPLVNVPALVIGAPVNSFVVPPAIEAIDTTAWS